MKFSHNRLALFFSIIALIFSSCVPQEKLKYVQDETSTEIKPVYKQLRPEKRIRPFDNLYINVMSLDEQTARIFSNQNNSINGALNVNLLSYMVNERGAIDFPFIGDIYLVDLTLAEAKVKVESELSQYLSNTAITMKFVNSNITVLGEVRNQGEFPFFKEQINIFQALGYAGGITDYGDKSKVTLIRERNNEISYYYLNLTDKKIVESDLFYLEPGDVVIVEAINLKNRNLRPFSYSSFLATITTIVTVLIFLQP
ncbi:MAG: polysaccharide biosynthesis/export family protein [Bacteroidales bacterium]|nr:polysaccharide biosynthesis/export family protein [Bacteroidales bacterium]